MTTAATTLTPEQQALRRGRFTSTKIVDLVEGRGFKVFNDWFGYSAPWQDSVRPRWGRRLERIIIEAAAEEQGWSKVEYPGTVVDSEDGLFATSADFVADGEIAGDAKNRAWDQAVHYRYGEAQQKEIIQVTVHCGVLKKPRGVVAALIDGNDLRVIPVPFDPDTWGGIKEMCHRFKRDHLDTGRPPPVDGSDAVDEYLKAKFPTHKGPMLAGDESSRALALAYEDARVREKTAKEEKDTAGNGLRSLIGDAEGVLGTGWKCTWKNSKGSDKTDHEAMAAFLMLPLMPAEREALIRRFTKTQPGARSLRCTIKGEK